MYEQQVIHANDVLSPALCIHVIACRLLRATPRPRAWQILLATSCDAVELKSRGSTMWRMTSCDAI